MAPRQARTVQIEAVAPEATAPVVAPVVIAPEGTAVPPVVTPTVSESLTVITPPAAPTDLPDNSAPVVVPVAPTAAQLAAREMRVDMGKAWIAFMGIIPGASGAAFAEPDDDEIDAMIVAYMESHPLIRMTKAAFAVKDKIDADRAAHEAALANSNSVKLEYYRAARHELQDMLGTVDQLIVDAGGKVGKKSTASTDEGAPRKTRASSVKWAEIAPKFVAYAKTLGLDGADKDLVYFVDITRGGYKGHQRPVCLHKDGTWTKATFNVDTNELKDTGVSIPTWKYYDVDGKDLIEGSDQKLPAHALSKDEMYGIALIKDGKVLDLPITYDLKDENGKRKPGTAKHYALYTVFAAAAGV